VTGHSHVLLDEVSGAALCLAAYMAAAILICEVGIPAAIRRKKKASTAQARQSRRAIRQRRQRCGRARRASRAHLPRSRYGVVQAARSQDGGLKNEGREAAPEHKPREPAPVAAGRAGRTGRRRFAHNGRDSRSPPKPPACRLPGGTVAGFPWSDGTGCITGRESP